MIFTATGTTSALAMGSWAITPDDPLGVARTLQIAAMVSGLHAIGVMDPTKDPADREHVSLYIYEHPERYKLHNVESGLPERYWDMRLTLDTPEDFELIAAICDELYPKNPAFPLGDVLRLLDRRPELLELNAEIHDKPVR